MKWIYSILAILLLTVQVQAQNDLQEQLKNSRITWFGIDYTQCRMVGIGTSTEPQQIVDVYFDAWNEFVNVEPDKYDVRKYLGREDAKFKLGLVKEKNGTKDPDSIVDENTEELKDEDVAKMLKAYDFGDDEGLGVMFFAEYYSKRDEAASYQCVVFDVKSKAILMTKRYVTAPKGFGFRNYWGYTIYATLKTIGKDKKQWGK